MDYYTGQRYDMAFHRLYPRMGNYYIRLIPNT